MPCSDSMKANILRYWKSYDRNFRLEFAFLLACLTAELTKESISDEGLHLSAAVQYSGVWSIIGTMSLLLSPSQPTRTL